MATKPFYTLLTRIGLAKETNASLLGIKAKWKEMAVGDGNGAPVTPDEEWTKLVNPKYRAQLQRLYKDPLDETRLCAELAIPINEGGFWIREAGIYDEDGELVAVGSITPLYKSTPAEGASVDTLVRTYIKPLNVNNIELKIDPTLIMASQSWVLEKINGLKDWVAANFSLAKLLPGGNKGMALVKKSDNDGDVDWEFISGVPIGTFSKTGATQADKGYINISYDQLTFWPVAGNIGDGSDAIGDLVTKCWVGSAANATAPYFFRCNADGTVRSDTGAYFAIPYEAQIDGRYVVETGVTNGISWRIFNDATVMQWGPIPKPASSYGPISVVLPIEMDGNDYHADKNMGLNTPDGFNGNYTNIWEKTSTTISTTQSASFDTRLTTFFVIGKAKNKPAAKPGIMQLKAWDEAVNTGDIDIQALVNALQEMLGTKVNLSDFTGGNQLLSGSGYQKLPGGLIIQWGQSPESNAAPFNIAFPNAAFAVIATAKDSGPQGSGYTTLAAIINNSTFRISYGGTINGDVLNWLAIGF